MRRCEDCRHSVRTMVGLECEAPGAAEYELGYAYAWERRGAWADCGVTAKLFEPRESHSEDSFRG